MHRLTRSEKQSARVPAEPSAKGSSKNSGILPAPSDVGKALALTPAGSEPRVDSRLMAEQLGLRHQTIFEMVKDYVADFEQLGKLRFQTGASVGSRTGQKVRFALLNEDQCYLLLTFSRNTPKVRGLKVKLVAAFQAARRAAQLRETEYLPVYHQLHDALHALGADAAHERFLHMNVNRLVNKVAGVEPGARARAAVPMQGMLIAAQILAADALDGAADHHQAYDLVKAALAPLQLRRIGPPVSGADACGTRHARVTTG